MFTDKELALLNDCILVVSKMSNVGKQQVKELFVISDKIEAKSTKKESPEVKEPSK